VRVCAFSGHVTAVETLCLGANAASGLWRRLLVSPLLPTFWGIAHDEVAGYLATSLTKRVRRVAFAQGHPHDLGEVASGEQARWPMH